MSEKQQANTQNAQQATKPQTKAEEKKKSELILRRDRIAKHKEILTKMSPEIIKALPASIQEVLNPDRMVRLAMTTLRRSKDLWKCTEISICAGVILAAQSGLEIDQRGQAWLIPRWNKRLGAHEAEFQIGYQGLLSLMRRASQVELFEARAVFENDKFDYQYGTSPFIQHKPSRGVQEPGKVEASYAVAVLKSGKQQFEVCEPYFLDKIKKIGGNVWDIWPEQMARKTAAIQLCKWLDSSAEVKQIASLDEMAATGVRQNLAGEYGLENFEGETTVESSESEFTTDDLMGGAEEPKS